MIRKTRIFIYFLFAFAILGMMYMLWQKPDKIIKIKRVEEDMVPGKPGHHLILMWRRPWGYEDQKPDEGQKAGDCTITYDRSKLDEVSAVIFHYSALDKEVMPWKHKREPNQVYIFRATESPSYVVLAEHRDHKKFDNNFINWTMTFRWGSDVFASYFTNAEQITKFDEKDLEELLAKKSKVALWTVSNCKLLPGSRMRMKLSEDLIRAGLPIHRFGKCFDNREEFDKMPSEKLQAYKFYLSFENAHHCKHYITEKVFKNGFESGRVPVVWGTSREDAKEILPRYSYVHVEDFDTPAKLAEYLLYLDKNDTAYKEYFDWRLKPDEEQMRILRRHFVIREELICDKLQKGFKRKSIGSISEWMFGSESEECLQRN